MKKTALLTVAVLAALASCSRLQENQPAPEGQATPEATSIPEDAGTVPGVAVVQFDDDMLALIEEDLAAGNVRTKSSSLNVVLEQLGISAISPVFPEEECPEEFRARERAFGLHRFYYVEYDRNLPVTRAAASLNALDGILSAEPQYEVRLNDTFNDPMLRNQWHYNNTTVAGADINVVPVWNEYTTGNPSVIVSVVDQGVDLQHEDLAANCLPGGPEGSRNFANGNYDVEPMPHGTHVAGTIAAVNNNGKGLCGIAGGNAAKGHQGVKIMSCQFFGTKRNGSAADGIRWSANHGAVISQNSWGYVVDLNEDGRISADELERAKGLKIGGAEKAAVDYFIKFAGCDANGKQLASSPMQGGIVIFSAGNDNIEYGAPANYEKILSVGATDRNGRRSSFSNFGDWVDICAPGSDIYSTLPDNQYGRMSGTSMACPHVSGVAALVISQCGGQGFTADMLWTKLVMSARTDIIKTEAGKPIGPLVDAYAAIQFGDSGDPGQVTDYTVSAQSNSIHFSFAVPEDSEGKANYAAMLFASKNRNSIQNLDPGYPGADVITASVLTSTLEVGATATGTISGLEFEQNYYVTLVPYSYSRVYANKAPVKSVRTDVNHAPTIALSESGSVTRKNYEVFSIPLDVVDPDGHELTVTYKSGSKADVLRVSPFTGQYEIYVTGPDENDGTFTGTVTASDPYGLSASLNVSFTLLPNHKPEVVSVPENVLQEAPGGSFTYQPDKLFRDEDGEPLSFAISVTDPNVIHAVSNGTDIIVTALRYGVGTVRIVATDAKKESAELEFSFLIRPSSQEVSLYPTPVIDKVYVSTGVQEEECEISVVGAAGGLVYQGTHTVSAFKPAEINLVSCAPGRYSVVFTYGGKKYKQTIVKK